MTAPALDVSGITAGYGRVMILDSVSVTVGPAEIVLVAGPNGAGKSTVLKAVAGLIPWVSGSVTIDGVVAVSGSTRDAARRTMGYVPQVANVFPSLTVRENLQLALSHAVSPITGGLDAAYELYPILAAVAGQSAGSLSGGERQSLAFAMAMVGQPDVLLLDEPTAALSPQAAATVIERIGRLRDRGVAVLLVEQNVNLALEIADRAYILDSGRNAIEGPASSIRDDPHVRKVYLGGHIVGQVDS